MCVCVCVCLCRQVYHKLVSPLEYQLSRDKYEVGFLKIICVGPVSFCSSRHDCLPADSHIDECLKGSWQTCTVNIGYKDIGYNDTLDIATQDFGH